MREQIEARLAELEAEIAIGEQRWREVDTEQARLRETLMRMSGAIQVLRELLEESRLPAAGNQDALGVGDNGQRDDTTLSDVSTVAAARH